MDEVRTALVQICRRAVSEGFVARVEGLIGITLANSNVFLVNIQEDFVDSKQIQSTNPFNNDHTSDDCGMEISGSLCADESTVTHKSSQKTNRSSAEPQKEVSKLDMLMRYSNNLFDQFRSSPSCRRQKAADCAPSSEQRGNALRQQQQQRLLDVSDEQPNDVHCPEKLQSEGTALESDQSFNTKDDPNCSGISEKVALRSYHSDRFAAAVSSKSSASQCQQQDDDGDGDETNPASQAPSRIPGYEFLPQLWAGRAFETFGAPNDLGENSESRPYVCELCDASFSKKFCLANHIVTVHQVGGKYICMHCGKQFLQKLRYMTHVDRHDNIRRHVCQLCGKAFSYKYSLWSHAKKCVGGVPGLDVNMFSTQPDPTFSTRVGPTVSDQTIDEDDVSSKDAADLATAGE